MSEVTPNSTVVRVKTERGDFLLVKDTYNYSNYWTCERGGWEGTFGDGNIGRLVNTAQAQKLYVIAKNNGYSSDDLAAPKRPEKAKSTGTRRTSSDPRRFKVRIRLPSKDA